MKTLEFTRQTMAASQQVAVASFELAIFSRNAPELDKVNEDAALICTDANKLLAAVADGAGGYEGGDDASQFAIKALRKSIEDEFRAPIEMDIIQSFEHAHERIRDSAGNSATTLALVYLADNSMRTFHVGDSGVLVIGGRGRLKYQTVAHSPTGHAIEAGTLDEDAALLHEDRYLVSNILGHDPISIEISTSLKLAARDTVLLASDGLFDNLYLTEICQLARQRPIKKACDALAEAASSRMTTLSDDLPNKVDDLTIVLVRLNNG